MTIAAPQTSTAHSLGLLSNLGRALRHRNYRLFFCGQLVSLVGTWLTQMAMAWFVWRLTNNSTWIGVMLFASQVPQLLLGPFAGVWADRVNKRKLVVLTQVLSAVQSFGLAAVAFWLGQGSHLNVHLAVEFLLGLAIFQGVINAFDMPARQAFLVEMVPDRADLPNAIALNSTMVHAARLIGPAAAGFIIAFVGESMCFFLDGISYGGVIISLLMMQIVPRPPRKKGSVFVELREGFAYVWGFAPVRYLLLLMALLSLTGMPAIQVSMPIFGAYFGGMKHGPETFGILGAASGLGALVGAIHLAMRRTVLGLGRMIAIGSVLFSIALMGFSQSRLLGVSLLIVPVIGWAFVTNFASANTILQTVADDAIRGRVMSFFAMAFVGVSPFGALAAGVATRHLTPAGQGQIVGASRTILIAGAISLIGAIVYAIKLPALRKLIRPVYVERGVLPAVAEGLQAADATPSCD